MYMLTSTRVADSEMYAENEKKHLPELFIFILKHQDSKGLERIRRFGKKLMLFATRKCTFFLSRRRLEFDVLHKDV